MSYRMVISDAVPQSLISRLYQGSVVSVGGVMKRTGRQADSTEMAAHFGGASSVVDSHDRRRNSGIARMSVECWMLLKG